MQPGDMFNAHKKKMASYKKNKMAPLPTPNKTVVPPRKGVNLMANSRANYVKAMNGAYKAADKKGSFGTGWGGEPKSKKKPLKKKKMAPSYHDNAQNFIKSSKSMGYKVNRDGGELIASKSKKKLMKTKPQGKGIVKALGQKGTTGNFKKIEKKAGKGAAIAALQNKLAAHRGKPVPFKKKKTMKKMPMKKKVMNMSC